MPRRRGPRSWHEGEDAIVPLDVIAARMRLSMRTVWSINQSAMKKLYEHNDYEELLTLIRLWQRYREASAKATFVFPRPGSVECLRTYQVLYSLDDEEGRNDI
jgi:hypothetical protein